MHIRDNEIVFLQLIHLTVGSIYGLFEFRVTQNRVK